MILIRDASLVDGTGASPREADVLVSGNRIAAVGKFRSHRVPTIIDGHGGYLFPGFIDVNTDSDHYLTLFSNSLQHDFLLQGVTTIIGGHCGSSLAPLLYGTLESIRKWTDPNQINVGWHTVREFLDTVERQRLGVNFGTLIGHATIRRALIGDEFRDLTANELRIFERTISEALQQGAFGLSTGLGYAHGSQVPYREIKTLAKIVGSRGGIYATHLRNEREGLARSMEESIRLAQEAEVSTLISHFRPVTGFAREFEEALALIDSQKNARPFRFDCYPSNMSMHAIYLLLPAWMRRGSLEEMRKNLEAEDIRRRALKELPVFREGDLFIAYAQGAPYLVGKSIGEFAANRGLDPQRALLLLMQITKLRAVVLVRNVNMDAAVQALCHPRALVASNAPSFPHGAHVVRHERMTDTFPKFLRIVTKTNLLSIAQAISKITREAAEFIGIPDRGTIKEGMAADLVFWKADRVETVIVNGKIAVKDGAVTGVRAGAVLKKS